MTQSIRRKIPGTLGAIAISVLFGLIVPMNAATSAEPIRAQGVITIEADHAKIHRLSRAASTIIIGNPVIADVTVEGGKLLVITGKNYGTTNLIALDRDGIEIGHFKLHVKTNGIHKLTVHSGVARMSYSCAPRCEREIQVGDAPATLEALSKGVKDKAALAKSSTQDNNIE